MNTVISQCVKNTPTVLIDPDGSIQKKLDNLTKPPGSLGRLEELALRLCSVTGTLAPVFSRKRVFVMAGDHGVVEEGVSAFPQEVTGQMLLNFASGGAAVNVFARQAGAEVIVADVGSVSDIRHEKILSRKLGAGTANMAKGPAMSREDAEKSVVTGIEIARGQIEAGCDLAAVGEMGIGNTTPATAIFCLYTGLDPVELTGPGTGLNAAGVLKKAEVIQRALKVNSPNPADVLDVLCKVGGFEIGAMTGVILACAEKRVPVIIDGFISTAAGLLALKLSPAAQGSIIVSHRSAEPGHKKALEMFDSPPLIDLDLRLGEGTGAVLTMQLCDAAAAMIREMATFADAGISSRDD